MAGALGKPYSAARRERPLQRVRYARDVVDLSVATPFQTPAALLPMRVRPAVALDDDALFALCRANPDLRIERDHDGELIVMSPTGGETGRRNFRLTTKLGVWTERDGTGVGFDSSTGFVLPNGAERAPDAAWVKRARWDALTDAQRRKFVPLVPDFVVELRSASDDLETLHTKMAEYVAQGARLGWLLDPVSKTVWIYRPGAEAHACLDPETVSGEGVLPGFELRLAEVW